MKHLTSASDRRMLARVYQSRPSTYALWLPVQASPGDRTGHSNQRGLSILPVQTAMNRWSVATRSQVPPQRARDDRLGSSSGLYGSAYHAPVHLIAAHLVIHFGRLLARELTLERDHAMSNLPRPRPARILIVEDELILATILKEILAALGYTVTGIAASFEATLGQVAQDCPDLALIDIRLPGERDGIDAATLLGEALQIPVLYLTGQADRDTLLQVYQSRPSVSLRKPVSRKELAAAIALVLRLNA